MANMEWSDEDLDDDEYPDESQWDEDDDETELTVCPECGSDVYEDCVQCPVCGVYITPSTHPLADWPWGWKLLGLCGVIATILLLLASALLSLW